MLGHPGPSTPVIRDGAVLLSHRVRSQLVGDFSLASGTGLVQGQSLDNRPQWSSPVYAADQRLQPLGAGSVRNYGLLPSRQRKSTTFCRPSNEPIRVLFGSAQELKLPTGVLDEDMRNAKAQSLGCRMCVPHRAYVRAGLCAGCVCVFTCAYEIAWSSMSSLLKDHDSNMH